LKLVSIGLVKSCLKSKYDLLKKQTNIKCLENSQYFFLSYSFKFKEKEIKEKYHEKWALSKCIIWGGGGSILKQGWIS
jgi:hypothetical protein